MMAAPPPTAAIRPAVSDDLPDIAAIIDGAYRPYVARIGREPGPMLDDYAALVSAGRVHVLDQGGVRGLVVLLQEGDTMLLDNVAVHPDRQGRGHGGLLMRFAEDMARAAGCVAIRLYTHETMIENIARYRGLGYVETHRAEENGLRRVFMRKSL
jgi:ribosomal protein S18 acetylase RimI-like enzyme